MDDRRRTGRLSYEARNSTMMIETELLRTMAYFAGLETADLEAMTPLFTEYRYAKGTPLLSEGDRSDSLYFIVSGLVKVYKTSAGGREQVLHIAPPGDSLNDVSLYDGGPIAAGMVALTPVLLYAIDKADLIRLFGEKPAIMLNVIRALAARIRRDSNLLEDLSSSQVQARLAKLFLGRFGGEEITAGLNLTQKDMAGLVGSSREMVNRSLKALEDMGGIRLSRRKVIVVDKDVLRRAAAG